MQYGIINIAITKACEWQFMYSRLTLTFTGADFGKAKRQHPLGSATEEGEIYLAPQFFGK